MSPKINRRQVLLMTGAALLGRTLGAYGTERNTKRGVEPVGLQLFTVRNLLADDVSGTLAAIADAGYAEVETAGYAGLPAAEFAGALKAAGLRAPSAHAPLEAIESRPDGLLEDASLLGHRYIVMPWLSEVQRATLDGYRHVADVLNRFGEQCAAAGIQLAYHNHDFEFAPLDGVVPYDLLLERCDPAPVKFEMDLFWAARAGADAAAYFAAAPGRFPLCHVKDMAANGAMTDVGDGTLDFAALFSAGETGGLKHYFVEHDNPVDPLASIRRSIAAVRRIRY